MTGIYLGFSLLWIGSAIHYILQQESLPGGMGDVFHSQSHSTQVWNLATQK